MQNPKAKIYEQRLKWLKEKWEACYKPNKDLTEKLIKLWNTNREKNADLYQHWLSVGDSLARCNLDELDGKQIEDELQVAIFLQTVKDLDSAKQLWEKRNSRTDLEKYIKSEQRVQENPQKSTRGNKSQRGASREN